MILDTRGRYPHANQFETFAEFLACLVRAAAPIDSPGSGIPLG